MRNWRYPDYSGIDIKVILEEYLSLAERLSGKTIMNRTFLVADGFNK